MEQQLINLIAQIRRELNRLKTREKPEQSPTVRLNSGSPDYLTVTEHRTEAGDTVTFTLGFKGITTDERVKVSADDTSGGYLSDKLAWADDFEVELETLDDQSQRLNISLTAQPDEQVKVSATDKKAGFLADKLVSEQIQLTVDRTRGDERLRLTLPETISISTRWQTAELGPDWATYPNWQAIQYKRVSRDQVALRGRAGYQPSGVPSGDIPPDGSLLFVLPIGFRPTETISLTGYSGRARLVVPEHDHTEKTELTAPYTDYQGADDDTTTDAGGMSSTSQAGGNSNTSYQGSTSGATNYQGSTNARTTSTGSGTHSHRLSWRHRHILNWRHRHTLNWLHSHTLNWLHNHIFAWRHRHRVEAHGHIIPTEPGFDSFKQPVEGWLFVGGNTEIRIRPNGEVRLYDAGADGYVDAVGTFFVD